MTRPAGCGRAAGGVIRLALSVRPGASEDRIVGLCGAALRVAVSAAPERGRANEAVCRLLAKALGVPASAVRVVSGLAGRRKVVAVEGVSAERLEAFCASVGIPEG